MRTRPIGLPLALGLALVAACDGDAPPAPEPLDAQFDRVWADFDATYPYFTLKGVDWAAAGATWRPQALAARSEAELVAVLAGMLGELRDLHVRLTGPGGQSIATWTSPRPANIETTSWQAYLSRWGVQDHGGWGHGMIGAVPYVYISSWASAPAGFDAALEAFRGAPGMILDLRMNGGGNSAFADAVAARFADATRLAFTVRYRNGPGHDDFGPPLAHPIAPGGAWQFTGPVLLLLGAGSLSSTEDFAAGMRELPHVSLVGDATGGASANPASRPLAGGWSYLVSRWFLRTADGLAVEGAGIPPHVPVAASAADFAAGRDPVLDHAEAWAAAPAVVRPP
jgi:carboxyl-terminal processing protease